MDDAMRDRAKLLADALAKKGIVSDDPPLKPRIRALRAAESAYYEIGAGNRREWRQLMELRQTDERSINESNWKLAAFCSQALKHPDLPESLREEVQFAWGYFSGKTENLIL